MAWGEGSGFTEGYEDALKKASERLAHQHALDAQRKAKDNPIYKIGQILEPIGQIADVGLMAFGQPPIAGQSASALKKIAGAASGVEGEEVGGAAKDLAGVASAYMKWKSAKKAKKKQEDFIDQMKALIDSQGSTKEPAKSAEKPEKQVSGLDGIVKNYANIFV